MRADYMGVGHIDAMSDLSRCDWDPADVVERGAVGREHYRGVFSGCGVAERDEADEPSEHRVGERDGAWVEHGADDVHWESSGGTDGV